MGKSSVATSATARRRTVWPIAVVLVALVVVGVGWAYQWKSRDLQIRILDGSHEIALETRAETVADALAEAGIELEEGDAVEPGLSEPLVDEMQIRIERATLIHVNVDNQRISIRTLASTVAEALHDANVTVNEVDRVTPALSEEIESGLEIRVVRITEALETETETRPFQIVNWADPTLARGETRLHQEGQEGLIERTIRIVYEDGVEVSREVIGEELVRPVRNRIIYVGSLDHLPVVMTPDGPREYIEKRQMVATGYEASPVSTGIWSDGYTYTGLVARHGIIATDPSVIPLGTELYVPGYGVGVAADIGGAIKGNIIDLFFESIEEALEWGRQNVEVYILKP